MRTPIMAVLGIVVAVVLVATAAPASAHDDDLSPEAIRRFDRFLDDHPWVARDLEGDPTLVNDPRYVADHRSLADFLDDHPDVRHELRRDPYAVLRRLHRLERAERRNREISRRDLQEFERFLRDHPGVAHDLRGDASLVTSRRYLADHPSFQDFLHDHPDVREELQQNPYAFLRRFERYQHDDERGDHRTKH
jgi:hypothetical protein